MKYSLKTEITSILILVTTWILGIYFYFNFPDRVITHWNFYGEPDGFSGRFTGALMMPIILLGMYLLFLILPSLDPKKERYESFFKVYNILRTAILLVMFLIFTVTGLVNLGIPIDINIAIPSIIGVLFIVLGNYMGKVKQNWFFGFRLPWTLSSENVWNKTNRFGGWSLIILGILIIIVPFLSKNLAYFVFISGILFLTMGTAVYSYFIYKKEQQTLNN